MNDAHSAHSLSWSAAEERAGDDAPARHESGIFPTDEAFVFDDGDDDDAILIEDITIDERSVVEKVGFGTVDPVAALAAAIIEVARVEVHEGDLVTLMQIGSVARAAFPAQVRRALVDAGLVIDTAEALLAKPAFAIPARAWRRVLRDEEGGALGEIGPLLLDEWAASVAAALAGDPTVEPHRRELRRRGVAAFGLATW